MTAEPYFPPPEAEFCDRVFALLAALGIDEVIYALNGSGDSGESELDGVHYADGRTAPTLPKLPIGFCGDGKPRLLAEYLDDLSADAPEGDWVNNEGGYGTVTFRPSAEDPFARVECDMTYREEGDYGDDDEEDDFDEVDFDPDEARRPFPSEPLLVIAECGL